MKVNNKLKIEWTHPLTIPGKTYLKKFAKDHPDIQVVFG